MTAAIPATLALLGLLLLWILVAARGPWWAKLGLIAAVPFVAATVWLALPSYAGWPTTSRPPADAQLVYGAAVEPDPRTGSRGAIFLWLIPLHQAHGTLAYTPAADEPRAYRLPYSRELHEQLEQAKAAARRGAPVGVRRVRGTRREGGSRGRYVIYRLPPPQPPRKTGR